MISSRLTCKKSISGTAAARALTAPPESEHGGPLVGGHVVGHCKAPLLAQLVRLGGANHLRGIQHTMWVLSLGSDSV